jgi:hypothetical protein
MKPPFGKRLQNVIPQLAYGAEPLEARPFWRLPENWKKIPGHSIYRIKLQQPPDNKSLNRVGKSTMGMVIPKSESEAVRFSHLWRNDPSLNLLNTDSPCRLQTSSSQYGNDSLARVILENRWVDNAHTPDGLYQRL